MSPPTALERLVAERDAITDILTAIELQVNNHAAVPLTTPLVEAFLQQCTDQLTAILQVNGKIRQQRPADLDDHKAEFTRIFNQVNLLHSTLHGIKASFPVPGGGTPTSSGPAPQPKHDVRLPRLDIPIFSGNLMEWVSFRDIFTTVIHNSTTYSGTQKFAHLKSLVQGEPLEMINSIILSDANYDIAWALLNKRYQNNRELLFAILRRFTSLPVLQQATASELRNLVDKTQECIRSFGVMGIGRDAMGDAFLLFLIGSRMDNTSKRLWEQTLKDTSIPQLEDLLEFLEQRARSESAGSTIKEPLRHHRSDGRRNAMVNHSTESNGSCRVCHGNHPIYKCHKFSSKDNSEKSETVKKLNLCFNCLQPGQNLMQCPSSSRCRTCNGKHHTLIHRDNGKVPSRSEPSHSNHTGERTSKEKTGTSASYNHPLSSESASGSRRENGNHVKEESTSSSMLATALVSVTDGYGQQQICRAFLDGGATASFITQACLSRLGLRTSKSSTEILGLTSASIGNAKGTTTITFTSHFASHTSFKVQALILPKITGDLPVSKVDPSHWPHLQNLQLADPQFNNPKPIDILLGSDIFWNLLVNGKRTGAHRSPVAINSKLGWLVAGPTDDHNQHSQQVCTVQTLSNDYVPTTDCNVDNKQTLGQLDVVLRRFWELEALPLRKILSCEEQECERHFETTHSRLADGRFQVRIPLNKPPSNLGDSYQMALRRFKHLEKRLTNHPEYRSDYVAFMKEYLDLGHMSVAKRDNPGFPVSYLPHHFVIKEDSTTTKLRVVFDASAKTTSGQSLNDIMMVGPVIQDNLVDIIMRFRCNPIAYTADIAKMYRQIRVPPPDAELQRILWRNSPDDPIITYRLDTVTYGTASAPYLATRVLQQVAHDESSSFPLAYPVLLQDFYVDDLMSGSKDVATAKETVQEILQMTSRGGLSLRKWSSNSKELLKFIPEELRSSHTRKEKTPNESEQFEQASHADLHITDITNSVFSADASIKCLGILWDTEKDNFLFRVDLPESHATEYTKRKVLSEIARLFDPLGWLAPVIITAKIFMQALWKVQQDWDTPLPATLQQTWMDFKQDVLNLKELRIPRCVIPVSYIDLKLAGFCDASETAYSAVVFLCVYEGSHKPLSSMIASKTRVAPAKTISLPKLELCGALLLTNLIKDVKKALRRPVSSIHAWTDSTVALAWIKTCPSKLKTFVANRVSDIITDNVIDEWHHIPGTENPADCASRGITAKELISHSLWWNGPNPNLYDHITDKDNLFTHSNLSEEERNQVTAESKSLLVMSAFTSSSIILELVQRKSNLHSLRQIVGWIRRFIQVCRNEVPRNHGYLRVKELQQAEQLIVKSIQRSEFYEDIQHLEKNLQIPAKSKIASLNPRIDETGILRVGGRLRHASLSYNQKHQILLPRHSKFTEMVILSKHKELQHAGTQLLLATLQRQYWIVRGRDAIRFLIRKCVTCHRHRATFLNQIMGDLPAARVTPNPAFYCSGVDYAGPFLLKTEAPRSKVTFKAYLCIFVCFSTRAIHIEIASSLSTSAFMAALKRFVSRRNCPAEIYSDCGTNFVGAAKELKEFQTFIKSTAFNSKVSSMMSVKGIQWNFNPPSAPHFGGLWEAGVKSIKFHLHRVLGAARLSYEELSTLTCQIEATLNSRPLTPVSSSPDDLTALTPGHFLTGSSLSAVPEPNLLDLKTGRLDRWQLVQQMRQQFWSRWSGEYISRLQQRPKWLKERVIPKVGDLTIIKDERLPPQQWRLGRITSLHHGADGFPRVADLKTSDGEIRRPIVKLSLLPIETSPFCTNDVI